MDGWMVGMWSVNSSLLSSYSVANVGG